MLNEEIFDNACREQDVLDDLFLRTPNYLGGSPVWNDQENQEYLCKILHAATTLRELMSFQGLKRQDIHPKTKAYRMGRWET